MGVGAQLGRLCHNLAALFPLGEPKITGKCPLTLPLWTREQNDCRVNSRQQTCLTLV